MLTVDYQTVIFRKWTF